MSADLLRSALARRRELIARLEREGTDSYRLLHGVAEGREGLTIDRYGPILLFQTWREPLAPDEIDAYRRIAEESLGVSLRAVWNHRARGARRGGPLEGEFVGTEQGARFDVTPRHRGLDPLLFLDFRAGRRLVRERSESKRVLNLFGYTGGVAVAAALGGASLVWHVDFSRSALAWTRRNLELNGISADRVRLLREDAVPLVRQLAGLPVKGRGARQRRFTRFEPRSFDLVVLDPPAWSKSPFGAVDVVRDYPSLLKPALLATEPGGALLVTNNHPRVSEAEWHETLRRTASRCVRPIRSLEPVLPEGDFPSRDGSPPLKMAWLEV